MRIMFAANAAGPMAPGARGPGVCNAPVRRSAPPCKVAGQSLCAAGATAGRIGR